MAENLEDLKGERFIKDHHGIRTVVILEGTRRNKVVVRQPERADAFTISTSEFQKKYRLLKTPVAS